jgi:hypothetical protein
MKINLSLADSDEPVESNPVLSEARGRIIWGEETESVRDYLISKGIEREKAVLKIAQFQAERNSAIRKTAIKKVALGGLLFGMAVILLLFCTTNSRFTWNGRAAKGLAGVGLAGCYGFYLLVNGIIYLVRPQCEKESISDMTD